MDYPSKKRNLDTDSADATENDHLRKKKTPIDTSKDHSNNEPSFSDWSTGELLDLMLDEPSMLVSSRSVVPPVNNNLSFLENDTPPEQVVLSLLTGSDSLPPIHSETLHDRHTALDLADDDASEEINLDPASDTKIIIEADSPEPTQWDDNADRPAEPSSDIKIITVPDSPKTSTLWDENAVSRPAASQAPPSVDTQTQSLQQTKQLQPWAQVFESSLRRLKTHSIVTAGRTARKPMALGGDVLTLDRYKTLELWWFDAHQHYRKGTVYLFGKVLHRVSAQYTSCCVLVKNIPRTIYVLPRPYHLNNKGEPGTTPVTMDNVKEEITQLLQRHNISNWKCSVRTRKYAFGMDNVPLESEYLKIQYSFEDPELPGDMNGSTFSHIFGTNNTPMELLLTKRRIKGPQWLEIKNVECCNGPTQETWCHYEFTVPSHKDVHLVNQEKAAPPISVLSLHLSTTHNPKSFSNEIIAAAILFCPKVMLEKVQDLDSLENSRFAVVRPWGTSTSWPADLDEMVQKEKEKGLPIRIEDSEYALLNYLCAKIHLCDPDVIVGHGFSRFTLDVLLHRMKVRQTSFWHKIGRLRWKSMPKLQPGPGGIGVSTGKEKGLLAGRLVCDTMTACRILILTKSYNLNSLAETQLLIHKDESRPSDTMDKSAATLHLVRHCWMDAYLSMCLLFKFQFLPLTKKLTNIAGNLWSRSLEGSRMNRNEFLLLHEFHQQKYICPDKVQSDYQGIELEGLEDENSDPVPTRFDTKLKKKKGPSYGGGLLLEPKIGLYEHFVVLLDFNSLYPSIIQEFNICFTTVDMKKIGEDTLPDVPGPDIPLGVLPRLMKRFVDERKKVKQKLKDPELDEGTRIQYDIEQNALKLTANSLYGSLGSGFSRFTAKHLAAMITSQGRSILRDTVDSVEQQLDMDVVYGDTDSIMIATCESTIAAAQRIATKVQQVINGRYQLLELGIDGYFRRLLILGKKNYASLTMVKNKNDSWDQVIMPKGSSVLRKDMSELSLFTTMRVLKVILSNVPDKRKSIHDALKRINRQVRSGAVPLTKFVIHKQLVRDLDTYVNTKGQTHIQLAMKLRNTGHIIKGGDTLAYVVCLANEQDAAMIDKTVPLSQVESGLRILDYDWYFEHEILPSVTRLCDPIMDTSELATCLDITLPQPTTIRRRRPARGSEPAQKATCFKPLDRKTGIEPFKAKCPHCQALIIITGCARYHDNNWVCGFQCTKCDQPIPTTSLACQFNLACRYYIQRYYQAWIICQELDCDYRTRDCTLRCPVCRGDMAREYSEHRLYAQLLHFESLFNPKQNNDDPDPAKQTIVNQYLGTITILRSTARKYLDQSSYRFVNVEDYSVTVMK